jgi:glutamine synthetase
MDLAHIQDQLNSADVHTLRIEFADQHGVCRSKIVPVRRLEEVLEEGISCAQPTFSLDLAYGIPPGTGTAEAVEYADMAIIPDPGTFTLVPYQPGTARMIGDIYVAGKPFPYSPRCLLKKVLGLYHELGMDPIVATELEFFVFDAEGKQYYQDKPSCVYTTGVRVDPLDLLPTLQNTLLEMGLDVLYINHEFFASQYEVNGRHTTALEMADQTFTFKTVCKDVAFQKGLLLTFMGRPKNEAGGSGYHLHFSLNDKATGKSLFDDPSAPDGVPDVMRQFIAGQMAHAAGMTSFLAPTVNSYKRYVPNAFAPYYIAWGLDNRTTYIRVPGERGRATRVENRAGCASANPYFAIAVTLLAGLDGIRNKMALGEPYVGDVYGEAPGKFPTVPFYLHEAVAALENDKVLCELIGPEIIQNHVVMKQAEAEKFRTHVTQWEFNEYAYHL